MKKFTYRMQSILDIKSKMETQAKNEYAAANLVLMKEQEKLSGLFSRKKEIEEEARGLRKQEKLCIRDMEENKHAVEWITAEIRKQAIQVHAAEKELENKRRVMIKLRQETKTHEILREKAFDEYRMEDKAEESKEIDQLTSYTYVRKQQ